MKALCQFSLQCGRRSRSCPSEMAATAQDPSAPLRGGEKLKDDEREEDTEYSPFYGIEKGAVLQEARIFNDSHVDARRCQQVITKLLYLLCQGETFTKKEATDVFFSVTKLFQAKDANLRRMVYLVIKEIMNPDQHQIYADILRNFKPWVKSLYRSGVHFEVGPGSDEVIIIVSSLMKDMNSKVDLYRSNAIRVLCHIADSQVLGNIERYFKQAVVDKSAPVASAVLVSAMHMLAENTEVVKRWSGEIQEVVQSKHGMVQFHAVSLLHALRAKDRLAVSKLVSNLVKGNIRSPLAQCMLVRYVARVIGEAGPSSHGETRPFYDFLESCLRHKSEMVMFEACKAICNMPNATTRELMPPIVVCQLFLSSSKPYLRFAAVRLLNKVAMTNPIVVTNCNIDLENLISDQNRSIATLAITTLLKTGSENSVDRLLKQIGNFMSEIADEFKIVVVEAIRALCLKFPQKYRSLMTFLSNVLREDGGFEYKKVIVDSILILIREIPEAKEPGLGHLCEFIEDCEFTYLSTQILHLLGVEGPATQEPSKYIRFIYNRIILENATVRAAAVSSLAKFGATVEALQEKIVVLLTRALHDNDDEVRDRATIHLAELTQPEVPNFLTSSWDIPAENLHQALEKYVEQGNFSEPFSLDSVPKAAPSESRPSKKQAQTTSTQTSERAEEAASFEGVPELAHLGQPFQSTPPERLTEEETEYNVTLVKHIFEAYILLQFSCTNTVAEQVLEGVSVSLNMEDAEGLTETQALPIQHMRYNEPQQTYILLEREPNSLEFGSIVPNLQFTIKEIDPSTGDAEEDGYPDEYQLEGFEISMQDYIKAQPVQNFRHAWEELDPETEMADDYGLGQRESLQEAVEAITTILGMAACEGSDAVPPNARSHTLLLAGKLIGDAQVVVRLSLGIDASKNVAMKLVVRSSSAEISEVIHQIIQNA